jgi:hypothetical protein
MPDVRDGRSVANPSQKALMSGSCQQSLVDARKLVRTFASAPDARRRAQAVISELKRAEGWSVSARNAIAAADAWLAAGPPMSELEGRLRDLLTRLGRVVAPL